MQPGHAILSDSSHSSDPPSLLLAERAKAKGNDAFRKGDFVTAAAQYALALRSLSEKPVQKCRATTRGLRIALLNNLALALLKTGQSRKALDTCRKVLREDPGNFKASWRCAVALEEECRFEEAVDVLQRLWRGGTLVGEERGQVSQKLRELRRNAQTYVAPALAESERHSWLNQQQRLRLSIKGDPFPRQVAAGEQLAVDVELFVSNEFGERYV